MNPEKTIKDNSNERYHELHNLEEFKDIVADKILSGDLDEMEAMIDTEEEAA